MLPSTNIALEGINLIQIRIYAAQPISHVFGGHCELAEANKQLKLKLSCRMQEIPARSFL
jgi:hypothetical protein